MRPEAHFQHMVSHQQEEYAHKQQSLFQQLDSALKDKDSAVQVLKQELANNKERSGERRAQVVRPVFAHGLSSQPYATPIEKKTFQAAAANAVPVQAQSPAFSLGASANHVNLRARSKGSGTMAIPVY